MSSATPKGDLVRLHEVVAQAVELQAEADEVIAEIRENQNTAEVVRRAGAITSRLLSLRDQLALIADSELRADIGAAQRTLDYDLLMLKEDIDLFMKSWRSPRLEDQRRHLAGLGPAAATMVKLERNLRQRLARSKS